MSNHGLLTGLVGLSLALAACGVEQAEETRESAAPLAPTGVTAVAGDGFVRVEWSDASDNETGFVVYRSPASATLAAQAPMEAGRTGAGAESFIDFAARPSAEYVYSVAAIGVDGIGEPASASGEAVSPHSITLSADLALNPTSTLVSEAVTLFEASRPAIDVTVVDASFGSARLDAYRTAFDAGTGEFDVVIVDTVWLGELTPFLVDLSAYAVGQTSDQHFANLVNHASIDGGLRAIPALVDPGVLYFRTDLLAEYGFGTPPATWSELEAMATTIQAGERAAGNSDFWGYVWQGDSYEGLTVNALEWIASSGGGTVLSQDGRVTVNNAAAVGALETAAAWVGTISPGDVTTYREEEGRSAFQLGNAAFMRNWPYAYLLGQAPDSGIAGIFDIAPLPAGVDGQSSGALGGWYFAVPSDSHYPEAASELVGFLTSHDEQKRRALEAGFHPTRPLLFEDADLIASIPGLDVIGDAVSTAVPRPGRAVGVDYTAVSTAIFTEVHAALTGGQTVADALQAASSELASLTGLPEGGP